MTAPEQPPAWAHRVTLVIDMPVTKLDALDVVAFVADSEVEGAGTVAPRVWLGRHVWVEVEIPRFADPPPIAIDVLSDVSREHSVEHGRRLAAALERVGWTVRSDFAR